MRAGLYWLSGFGACLAAHFFGLIPDPESPVVGTLVLLSALVLWVIGRTAK